jgi:hypothetical protein
MDCRPKCKTQNHNKRKWAIKSLRDRDESEMHIVKWKKPVCDAIYGMMPVSWHSGKGNTIEKTEKEH